MKLGLSIQVYKLEKPYTSGKRSQIEQCNKNKVVRDLYSERTFRKKKDHKGLNDTNYKLIRFFPNHFLIQTMRCFLCTSSTMTHCIITQNNVKFHRFRKFSNYFRKLLTHCQSVRHVNFGYHFQTFPFCFPVLSKEFKVHDKLNIINQNIIVFEEQQVI